MYRTDLRRQADECRRLSGSDAVVFVRQDDGSELTIDFTKDPQGPLEGVEP